MFDLLDADFRCFSSQEGGAFELTLIRQLVRLLCPCIFPLLACPYGSVSLFSHPLFPAFIFLCWGHSHLVLVLQVAIGPWHGLLLFAGGVELSVLKLERQLMTNNCVLLSVFILLHCG